jgi:hypothetical protein
LTERPNLFHRLFSPDLAAGPGVLWPRWIFLRGLGVIFFSAFYSLAFQIKGLIGSRGILPATAYLQEVARVLPGASRFWRVPTVLWVHSGDGMLTAIVWAGLIASVLLVLNVWPRLTIGICLVCFLSFIGAAQDFASYQSDGMLLEAGFLSLFLAPRGLRPGLGSEQPPSRASLFLLQWEWFRIYFESGVVKLLSGDEQWRHLTAMDHYYENGPLPSWPGWYVQQCLSHGFHAVTAASTLLLELVIVWMAWLPRRIRLACFLIVTPFQIGIILTANYAFLNYLVLLLGVLLLDDRALAWIGLRTREGVAAKPVPQWRPIGAAVALVWIFYATVIPYVPAGPLDFPERVLRPFRIANRYGLFAVMTRARYEIEFQGSRDGKIWIAYPFRYKPQDLDERPGIYAPYQPRFEWNLWFASLASWQENPWVASVEVRLLEGSPDVLALFRRDPFAGKPPARVRTVLWQYWFTTPAEKRRTGAWWKRHEMGTYAPGVERGPDGRVRGYQEEM